MRNRISIPELLYIAKLGYGRVDKFVFTFKNLADYDYSSNLFPSEDMYTVEYIKDISSKDEITNIHIDIDTLTEGAVRGTNLIESFMEKIVLETLWKDNEKRTIKEISNMNICMETINKFNKAITMTYFEIRSAVRHIRHEPINNRFLLLGALRTIEEVKIEVYVNTVKE